MELIVGLFWSHKEDGGMKVRFHLESVALGDGLVDLVVLLTIFGLTGVEGDVFVRAVRAIAPTGIFLILKNSVLLGRHILFVKLTLNVQKENTNRVCFYVLLLLLCVFAQAFKRAVLFLIQQG